MGCLIADHVKTSIGTLFNTGACMGAFALLVTSGSLLPKFVPSFCSYLKGCISEEYTRSQFYETARVVLSRRGRQWTPAMQAMWDAVYESTAAQRSSSVAKG